MDKKILLLAAEMLRISSIKFNNDHSIDIGPDIEKLISKDIESINTDLTRCINSVPYWMLMSYLKDELKKEATHVFNGVIYPSGEEPELKEVDGITNIHFSTKKEEILKVDFDEGDNLVLDKNNVKEVKIFIEQRDLNPKEKISTGNESWWILGDLLEDFLKFRESLPIEEKKEDSKDSFLSIVEVAKMYGRVVKYQWLGLHGDECYEAVSEVDADLLRQMENGSVKDVLNNDLSYEKTN